MSPRMIPISNWTMTFHPRLPLQAEDLDLAPGNRSQVTGQHASKAALRSQNQVTQITTRAKAHQHNSEHVQEPSNLTLKMST